MSFARAQKAHPMKRESQSLPAVSSTDLLGELEAALLHVTAFKWQSVKEDKLPTVRHATEAQYHLREIIAAERSRSPNI